MEPIADQEERRNEDRQGEVGIDAELRLQEIRAVERQHQQAAVGEVDDVQHAVDQREPERDQRVDRADGEAVQHGRHEDGNVRHFRRYKNLR